MLSLTAAGGHRRRGHGHSATVPAYQGAEAFRLWRRVRGGRGRLKMVAERQSGRVTVTRRAARRNSATLPLCHYFMGGRHFGVIEARVCESGNELKWWQSGIVAQSG